MVDANLVTAFVVVGPDVGSLNLLTQGSDEEVTDKGHEQNRKKYKYKIWKNKQGNIHKYGHTQH